MEQTKIIKAIILQNWLEEGKPVNILDIRPMNERSEWYIPQSIHVNAYHRLKSNEINVFKGLHLDKSVPVVTYCGGGKMSLEAAAILQKEGYDTYSLEDGIKGWSLAWNEAKLKFQNFEIVQFRRTGKGCLSYMIVSQDEAMIVDASLDIEVYDKYLKKHGIKLKYVTETHIHADHLSRSKLIAEKNNTPLFLPIPNKATFDYQGITENTNFEIGSIKIYPIKTPGHTIESTTFNIENKVLLTGDTLFTNGVGRPDLKADLEEVKIKSIQLYHSLQRLLTMDEYMIVLPSHTNQPVEFDNVPIQTTVKKVKSLAMLQLSEEEFKDSILNRIPATPENYLSIVEINITGNINTINPLDLESGANRCAIS